MSEAQAPCAACKCRRQKCTSECIFAPYFPSDDPQKFENVHTVFGASNVSKILHKLAPHLRQDAVACLDYQARYRIFDPVYGSVGLIYILQRRLNQAKANLEFEKQQLDTCIDLRRQRQMLLQQHQQPAASLFEIEMEMEIDDDDDQIWSLFDELEFPGVDEEEEEEVQFLPNESGVDDEKVQIITLPPNDLLTTTTGGEEYDYAAAQWNEENQPSQLHHQMDKIHLGK